MGLVSLTSQAWYDLLSEALFAPNSRAKLHGLATALKSLVAIDSLLILVYLPHQRPVFYYKDAEHKWRKNNIDEFLSGYYLLDPFYQAAEVCRAPCLCRLNSISSEDFYDTEYYESWYKQSGLIDEVNYLIPVDGGPVLAISLAKNMDHNLFSQTEISLLSTILPLVKGLLQEVWSQGLTPEISAGDSEAAHHRALREAQKNFGRSLLTEREFEIVQLLLKGHSTKSIAGKLDISPTTIKVHRKNIYDKLDISSHSDLFSLFFDALSTVTPAEGEDPLIRYHMSRRR